MSRRWLSIGIAVALGAAAFLAGRFAAGPQPEAPAAGAAAASMPSRAALDRLFAATLADPAGKPVRLGDWRGQPMLVNFWATWCPPCLREMPAFSRLQEKHPGVRFVGIAADSVDNVRAFVAKNPISYPIVLPPDGGIGLMSELGNLRGGLPFTIAVDSAGNARHVRLGGLSEQETEAIVVELERP